MAKVGDEMNWNEILQLREWSPLSKLTATKDIGHQGLFAVGVNAFVLTQSLDRDFEEGNPDAPFVTVAFWAADEDSLLRVVLGDPSIGGGNGSLLPAELAFGTDGTYAGLLAMGLKNGEDIGERGVYSNRGQFLYRALDVGRFSFYFLSPDDSPDARPFAGEVALVR
jgi:hypothetical protein